MSKGSARRPRQITWQEWERRFEQAFGKLTVDCSTLEDQDFESEDTFELECRHSRAVWVKDADLLHCPDCGQTIDPTTVDDA